MVGVCDRRDADATDGPRAAEGALDRSLIGERLPSPAPRFRYCRHSSTSPAAVLAPGASMLSPSLASHAVRSSSSSCLEP